MDITHFLCARVFVCYRAQQTIHASLSRLFTYWSKLTVWHISEQQRLQSAVDHIQHARQRLAIQCWTKQTRRSHAVRKQADIIHHMHEHRLIKGTLTQWLDELMERRGCRCATINAIRFWSERAVRDTITHTNNDQLADDE
jgi:hypothetical protein